MLLRRRPRLPQEAASTHSIEEDSTLQRLRVVPRKASTLANLFEGTLSENVLESHILETHGRLSEREARFLLEKGPHFSKREFDPTVVLESDHKRRRQERRAQAHGARVPLPPGEKKSEGNNLSLSLFV